MKTNFILIFTVLITTLTSYAQELALVRENDNYGYIDTSGTYVIEPSFEDAESFRDGRAAVEVDDLWGFIDATGKYIAEPDFEDAESFADGMAAVEVEDMWGFIDTSGNLVIETQYEKVKDFNSGYALVLKDEQWQYIDKKGQTLNIPDTTEKLFDFENGVAFFKKDEKIGLLGTDGKLFLEPTYDVIKDFKNGHARVRNGELWGMIDSSGKIIIPLEYEDVDKTWSPNGVYVEKGDVYGIFHNGKFNAIEGATDVWPFEGDSRFTYAEKDDKIGFVDSSGTWVIDPEFDKARAFSGGLAPVANGKTWGYINEKGETVIELEFRDAELFYEGLAAVKDKDWGFVDTSGKLVIPMEYGITAGLAFLSEKKQKGFINGLARVKSKEGWGFLDKTGALLGDTWFEDAELFESVE